jgi:hypothetical protein
MYVRGADLLDAKPDAHGGDGIAGAVAASAAVEPAIVP